MLRRHTQLALSTLELQIAQYMFLSFSTAVTVLSATADPTEWLQRYCYQLHTSSLFNIVPTLCAEVSTLLMALILHKACRPPSLTAEVDHTEILSIYCPMVCRRMSQMLQQEHWKQHIQKSTGRTGTRRRAVMPWQLHQLL